MKNMGGLFLHLIRWRIIQIVRQKSVMFWALRSEERRVGKEC